MLPPPPDAVVEVDPNTYQVRVERFIVAEDCGRVVNPMIVDGQVHGGVAQGIGAALFEEVVFNEDGQPVTASLVDYLIPTATEIPNIDVVHIEADSVTTLGGYRGMGEGGTIGAPAAIANAPHPTRVGVSRSSVSPTPSWPKKLLPQAQTQPSAVSAML